MIARSRQARADLVELAVYYGDRSPTAAFKLLDRIESVLGFLEANPHAGRARPELRQGVRSFPVRPVVVFYLPQAHGIEVVRVLHGARDVGPDFFEE